MNWDKILKRTQQSGYVIVYLSRWQRFKWWLCFKEPSGLKEFFGMKIKTPKPRLWYKVYRRLSRRVIK